ncbi:MAG TPA: hypothetical protein VIJ60_05475, partial [Acidimicrobiales bacterium]
FAVLYRTDAQAGPIADALDRRGFPVQVRSHERLADRAEVRAVVVALDAERTLSRPSAGATPTVSVAEQLDRAIDVADRPASASRVDRLAVRALLRPLAESYGTDLDRFLDDVELWTEVDTWDPRADRISLLTCTRPRVSSSRSSSSSVVRTGSSRSASPRRPGTVTPRKSGGCSSSA